MFFLISCCYYLLCFFQYKLFFVFLPNLIKKIPIFISKMCEYFSFFFDWIRLKWSIFVTKTDTTIKNLSILFTCKKKKKKKKNRSRIAQIITTTTTTIDQPSTTPFNSQAINDTPISTKKRSKIEYKKIKVFTDFDSAKSYIDFNKIENQIYKYRYSFIRLKFKLNCKFINRC